MKLLGGDGASPVRAMENLSVGAGLMVDMAVAVVNSSIVELTLLEAMATGEVDQIDWYDWLGWVNIDDLGMLTTSAAELSCGACSSFSSSSLELLSCSNWARQVLVSDSWALRFVTSCFIFSNSIPFLNPLISASSTGMLTSIFSFNCMSTLNHPQSMRFSLSSCS